MASDLFSIKSLSKPFNLQFAPKTFLQRTFVKGAETHDTQSFTIDKVTGGRRMSVFISPVRKGVTVRDEGMKTMTITPGYIKEVSEITPAETQNRVPGESIFGPHKSPAERSAELLRRKLVNMDNAMDRRQEFMVSQALTTGKVIIVEMNDVGAVVETREVDFGMTATHIDTVTTKWDDPAADPITDLTAHAQLLSQDGGMAPNILILGSEAAMEFIKNAIVQKFLDLRHSNLADLQVAMESATGEQYMGTLMAPGLTVKLYCYNEWYKDPATGTLTAMMPAKKVLLGHTGARVDMHYRVIEDFGIGKQIPETGGGNQLALRRRFKSWPVENPSSIQLLGQTGPIPVPVEIDAFGCLTVLT